MVPVPAPQPLPSHHRCPGHRDKAHHPSCSAGICGFSLLSPPNSPPDTQAWQLRGSPRAPSQWKAKPSSTAKLSRPSRPRSCRCCCCTAFASPPTPGFSCGRLPRWPKTATELWLSTCRHNHLLKAYVPVAPICTEKFTAEQYAQIKTPTLIVYGDQDVELGQTSLNNLRHLPEHQVLVLQGTGHPCYLDKPDEWHRGLLAFLQQLE
ncbi:uncharacterized protein AAGF69_010525 isoform 1-T1 [Amazona ochrocephala]